MGIIYILSVILLCSTFMLIKKSEKKLNFMNFLLITIVLLLAYNALVCYIINFFTLPITLLNLSIVNFILSIIMIVIIARKKEKQEYYFDKLGAVFTLIILASVLIVSYYDFGFPLNIKYESGDSAVHYLTSVEFAEGDSLLNLYKDDIYGKLEGRKIGSYVNSGIIMKCCSGFMDSISFYKIFIGFGIFILFMSGAMMYQILEKYTKNNGDKVLALFVSIIYVLGYPLNSLLFGFEYLSLGILILEAVIHMIYYYENEELKFPFYVIMFALINFDVFCSYYMFVPFTYSAEWIYFCVYSKKNYKKIITKKNVIMLVCTLLVPFVLGYIYHLAPGIYNILNEDAYTALQESVAHSSNILNNSFKLYGYIYVNYYSNFILFVPLAVYYFVKKIKEKNLLSFDFIMLVFLLAFIGLLLVLENNEYVSEYFLMKNYYALWIMAIYINFKGLMYVYDKNKSLGRAYVEFYLLVIILNLIFVDAPFGKGPGNDNEDFSNVVEIFGVNKTIIKERTIDYTQEQIEVLEYMKDNLDLENDSVEFMIDDEQMFWQYSMLKCINYDEFLDDEQYTPENKLSLKVMNSFKKVGKVKYMVYFNDSYYYEKYKYIVFRGGKVIYENSAGGIIQYEN